MLPNGSIRTERVWKRFRADRQRSLVRDELQRFVGHIRGTSDRGWTWALRDVGFEVGPNESVALIGANGSGKSTMLRLLSRVMYPYAGSVEVAGRVGALIEVRAGIHPDLTGRENAYLYGSLLGHKRASVAAKFDDIVAFAELERSIDRQVKFYSSGMQMRLGFAVAAFLDPDLLLVDEVLAVGDASFQQRCLDRIRLLLERGTTLVFVSHDLAAIEAVCTRGIWIRDGWVADDGPIRDVVSHYRQFVETSATSTAIRQGVIALESATVSGSSTAAVESGESLELTLSIRSPEEYVANVCIGISEGTSTPVIAVKRMTKIVSGTTSLACVMPSMPLPRGRYFVWTGFWAGGRELLAWQPSAVFDVTGPELDVLPRGIVRLSPIHVRVDWDVTYNGNGVHAEELRGSAESGTR